MVFISQRNRNLNMRTSILLLLILTTLIISAVPGTLAEESEAADENQIDQADPGVAIGRVYVTVLPWRPKLQGIGSGLFTYSEFDFSGFLQKVMDSFSALAGIFV